jgi:hypothetical protein
MPLTWSVEACRDYTELCGPEATDEAWEMTKAMIFETIPVGMDEITEDNAFDFWVRSCMIRTLDGWPCFTLDEVKRYIGLKTNASRRTKVQFRKYVTDMFEDWLKRGRTEHLKYYPVPETKGEEVTT